MGYVLQTSLTDSNLNDAVCCRDPTADASDPLVVSLSGCYGDDEAVLMWRMRSDDVSVFILTL